MIRIKLKNKFNSLKKLWKWIPIIWRDRDWDHYYIFEILKTKLEGVVEYTKKEGISFNKEYDIQKLKTALRLIDKVQNEYYLQKYLDEVDKLTEEDLNKALQQQKKAHKLLFKFLDHNILNWWD